MLEVSGVIVVVRVVVLEDLEPGRLKLTAFHRVDVEVILNSRVIQSEQKEQQMEAILFSSSFLL